MVHIVIQFQGLVLTLGFLVQLSAGLRGRDFIGGTMAGEERNRDLVEILLKECADPDELPHGAHAGRACVPSGVAGDDLELLGVLDGLLDHLVVGHHGPGVGEPEKKPVGGEAPPGGFHRLGHHEQGSGEDDPVPAVGVLEIHEKSRSCAHGFAEQKRGEALVGFAVSHGLEEVERRCGDLLHVSHVAADPVGSAVAEQIRAENRVAPLSVGDGDLLEQPTSVAAITMGHTDNALHGAFFDRYPRLGEQGSVRGFETLLMVFHPL